MATWGASADRIAVANDVSLDALLERTSQSVRIPSADGAAKEPRALDRFESVVIQSMATPAPAEASTSAATEAVTDFNVDVAFYTGGLVWCVAFCPERRAMAESGSPAAATPLAAKTELLAVALHPKGQTRNIMGAMHKGPGIVQLWAVPHTRLSYCCSRGVPRMLFGIVHDGRLTWDLKWCPDPSHLIAGGGAGSGSAAVRRAAAGPQQQLETAGVLAMVCGDGSVHVISVPEISALAENVERQQRGGGGGGAAAAGAHGEQLLVRIAPTVSITPDMIGGSAAAVCEWNPTAPHHELLVGCWDGCVSLVRLPMAPAPSAGASGQAAAAAGSAEAATPPAQSSNGRAELLLTLQPDSWAVRALAWLPPTPGLDTGGDAGNAFVTGSYSGHVRFWDRRDGCSQPRFDRVLVRCWVLGMAFNGVTLAVALEDGTLRCMHLDAIATATIKGSSVQQYIGPAPGSIWAVDACQSLGLLAYGGEAGVVALALDEPHLVDPRHRKPHVGVGAVRVKDGVLQLLQAKDVSGAKSGVFRGGSAYSADGGGVGDGRRKRKAGAGGPTGQAAAASFASDAQTLHAVRFSPNVWDDAVWLAHGGVAGFVRCQRVTGREVL